MKALFINGSPRKTNAATATSISPRACKTLSTSANALWKKPKRNKTYNAKSGELSRAPLTSLKALFTVYFAA